MNDTVIDLALGSRAGLPANIAYLRQAFPRPAWRADANYGSMADHWLQMHEQLRREGARLSEATNHYLDRSPDPGPWVGDFDASLRQFLIHLDQHHRIEDNNLFPLFRAVDPKLVIGFDLLERDHAVIHDALLDVAKSGQKIVSASGGLQRNLKDVVETSASDTTRLLELVDRHLSDEEELVIPALLNFSERSILGGL